jgi:alpha-amylase/alpha-mannosidase (GH57 family)
MDRFICIHGHFYQPPRENPWLEEVEFEDTAYPYHDWNEKITAECYAPNAASRILDAEGRIIDIVNIYSKISFDFGPTLLSWLERHKPDVYEALIEADRLSMENFSGHGSAIAQAYNHMIMPLANKNDKYTQVIWGIKDFQKRFGRLPEGMWLPEAAVDLETLETLSDSGIKFTILSQRQAKKVRKVEGDGDWNDVSGENIDPKMAYLCVLPSGRHMNIFFYDGPISQDVSFGGLLKNGEAFAKRLLSAFNEQESRPQIVHIATDGETFGHHHHHGDMALSYGLHYIESSGFAKLTNYSEYLEKFPPAYQVAISENTSWSCAHGVERWKANCGCKTGLHAGWSQTWRRPLRDAMDWLRDRLIPIYNDEAGKYFKDTGEARNGYIEVILDRSQDNVERFITKHSEKILSMEEKVSSLKLLEMQRNAMLMYTSCGWFFDDVSGIEAVQVMLYASKAIQYIEELCGISLEPEYMQCLENAPSNIFKNGAEIYKQSVKPAWSDLLRVGAHYSISSFFEEYTDETKIFCYTAKNEGYNRIEAGKQRFAMGKTVISSDITFDEKTIIFAVLHLGDHNINGGAEEYTGDEHFSFMQYEMKAAFEKGDIPEVIRLMDKHFGKNIYSLWHLFKDEQRRVLNQIMQLTYDGIEATYRQIYENNYAIMSFFHSLRLRLPRPFSSAAEYLLNTDLKNLLEEDDLDLEKLRNMIDEAKNWPIRIDRTTIGFVVSSRINRLMEMLHENPEDVELFKNIDDIMEVLKPLSLSLNLWKAQNIYFSIGTSLLGNMQERASKGDKSAAGWVEDYLKLGNYLHVKVTQ